MVKKDKNIANTNTQQIKSKIIRNNKPKNKEMFTQLQTHQQNKINKLNNIKVKYNVINPQKMDQQNEQDSYNSNQNIDVSKNNQDLNKVCAAVHHLILKNKINAKNAFQVPFIDLQQLQDFQKISDSQNGWRKISSTLQNDSKIYSYRVDAIHSIAYKIINTMSRNQDVQPSAQSIPSQQQQLKKQPTLLQQLSIPQLQGQDEMSKSLTAMLQKNIEILNMQAIDKVAQFNPTYERTRRRFDQGCLKGMLLNNLQIDANLQLSVNQTRKVRPSGLYKEITPPNLENIQFHAYIQVCKKIQNIKKSVYNTTKQQFIPSSGYELSWKQITSGAFDCETQQMQINENAMDIEGQEKQQNLQYKKVQDAIKMKNKKKPLKNSNDVAQDGVTWLSDIDKKMLGMAVPVSNNNVATVKKTQSKVQRNQDDIDFDVSTIMMKKDVYSQQTMQKLKNEYNQEIQQKHLLPIRLFRKFKVEQVMTLREQPIIYLKTNIQLQNQISLQRQQQRQMQQIDIKSQQLSIRESKQKLKQIMTKQTDYNTLYRKFTNLQHYVSPQLCFLTVLHLANENNLKLEQISQNNFRIKY